MGDSWNSSGREASFVFTADPTKQIAGQTVGRSVRRKVEKEKRIIPVRHF